MKYRTMSGCVTVTGPPASICALNFGTTDPFDASTCRSGLKSAASEPCRPYVPPVRDPAPDNTSRQNVWSARASTPALSPCRWRSSPWIRQSTCSRSVLRAAHSRWYGLGEAEDLQRRPVSGAESPLPPKLGRPAYPEAKLTAVSENRFPLGIGLEC